LITNDFNIKGKIKINEVDLDIELFSIITKIKLGDIIFQKRDIGFKKCVNLDLKKCGKCHEIKPVKDFNHSKADRTGYQSYCRDCSNKRRREYKNNSKKVVKKVDGIVVEKVKVVSDSKPSITIVDVDDKPIKGFTEHAQNRIKELSERKRLYEKEIGNEKMEDPDGF
jgi:hypothetical protein